MINFWTFFLKKTQFSILLSFALLIFGLVSLLQMPKESSPVIELPMAIVLTTMPGSPASDMEKLITNTLEAPIKNNVSNIKKLTSSSSNSLSNILVEFSADADIRDSIDKLRDEVDAVRSELPADANDPRIIQIDFAKQPIMTIAIATNLPNQGLLELSERVEAELMRVPGVSSVDITGIPKQEVHVLVNKDALSQYGLLLTDISRAISMQNVALPSGRITLGKTEYPVRFNGSIDDASRITNLPIKTNAGAVLKVGDVATVIDGFAKRKYISRLSIAGKPSHSSFSIDIFKSSSAQLTNTANGIRSKLDNLSKSGGILDSVDMAISFDSGEMLASDLRTLTISGITTVLLVMSILLLAIGWREALVAGMAIPLSFLTAFIGIKYSGNSINFVSLFALILSTGIIVDSAIVVVEGINAHMRGDSIEQSKLRAAQKAVTEYYQPLTSGTLTTIAVFAPLFTISGITGQFISAIPFTIIFVLLGSLFVALGIVPVFASMVLHRSISKGRVATTREDLLNKLRLKYRNFLYSFLEARSNSVALSTIMAILFVGALALPVTGAVRTVFFPGEKSDYAYVEAELKTGSTLTNTDIEMRKIEEAIYAVPGIKSFLTITGKSTPFSNNFDGAKSGTTLGGVTLTLDKDSTTTSDEIVTMLKERLKGIHSSDILVGKLEGGPPTGAPISITLYGEDLKELDKSAHIITQLLKQVPGTTGVSATTKDTELEFVIDVDRAKSMSSLITPMSIASSLNAAISGIEATTIKQLGDSKPVMVHMDLSGNSTIEQASSTGIDAIRYLPIANPANPSDSQVLLGSFTETQVSRSRSIIRHKDAQRISIIKSNLDNGANSAVVIAKLKELLNSAEPLPSSVRMEIGGENEEVDQSFADMFIALAMGMTVMFAILVIQFNSFKQTIYVLMTVPLSLIGVFAGLLIMDKALSFPAIMGFIALAGIVVNNGIILIDVINKERRRIADDSKLLETIVRASTSRLRPVLLTAMTTVIGILPLVFASGMWAPLAYSIVFGLTFATVLTLLLVPALYYRWPGKLHI